MKDDQTTLAEVKKPIDELVTAFFPDSNSYQKIRLRQLAWQAVDILANTGEVAGLRSNKDIERLILDVRQLGADDRFIEDSLSLAIRIFHRLQTDYPAVLERYRS